jgi:hypothetical protein
MALDGFHNSLDPDSVEVKFRTKPPLDVRALDDSDLPMVGYLLELLCD